MQQTLTPKVSQLQLTNLLWLFCRDWGTRWHWRFAHNYSKRGKSSN